MTTSSNNQKAFIEEDEISVRELILKVKDWSKYIRSKWLIILICATIGGLIGAINAYFTKTLYTAELTFVLEGGMGSGSQLGAYAGIASQFGIDMGGGSEGVFEGENFLALMKSRLMAEKALLTPVSVDGKNITLAEFYINIYGLREKWIEKKSTLANEHIPIGITPDKFSRAQNTIITTIHQSLLGSNLKVEKKDKKTSIIALQVSSVNEIFSKYYAEVIAKEVSAFYVETKTKKSADNLAILQFQTDSIKRQLGYSMINTASALDANPNANMARMVLRVPSQRNQGEAEINKAILTQLIQNLEIAKMSLRTETPLIQVIDKPVFPLVKSKPDTVVTFIKWAILVSIMTLMFLTVRRILNEVE